MPVITAVQTPHTTSTPAQMLIPKVLVANRGEIAVRILRSARELGWKTVALYTREPNLDVSHATYADEAIKLNSVSNYMDADVILEVATRVHCTHVHPGYGFLSESPALANALAKHNITFIGPSSDVLHLTGDKMRSRDLAMSLNVQVAPGTGVASSDEVSAFAARIDVGHPIVIKALDGGGGRGIRVVKNDSEVDQAFKRCMGESPSGRVFVEKALTGPSWKHIEIQVIGDGTGLVSHLWERECSVQRRFQKIIEVAPSRLSRSVIQILADASLKMGTHLKYKGLGTFEFLVNGSTNQWVFLEINPRVQVEHTVTEEITGIDLIRAQLLLFSSPNATLSTLGLNTPPSRPVSTAIQLRLTAENPETSFSLTPGTIRSSEIQWPAGRGVRIDTWLSYSPPSQSLSEWVIGTEFDSLLAKIIIHGGTFGEATQKARRALREFWLPKESKVRTNIAVLAGVLGHDDWNNGTIDTLWLERNLDTILGLGKKVSKEQTDIASLDEILKRRTDGPGNSSTSAPSSGGTVLLQPGVLFHLTLSPTNPPGPDTTSRETKKHTLTLTSIAHNAFPDKLSGVLQSTFSSSLEFSLSQSTSASVAHGEGFELADPNDPQHVAAPLTGKIVDIHPVLKVVASSPTPQQGGEGKGRVKRGETLVVMSAMKMESVIVAPHDGIVEKAGRGMKVGVIFGEGMLVCTVRPVGTSRL